MQKILCCILAWAVLAVAPAPPLATPTAAAKAKTQGGYVSALFTAMPMTDLDAAAFKRGEVVGHVAEDAGRKQLAVSACMRTGVPAKKMIQAILDRCGALTCGPIKVQGRLPGTLDKAAFDAIPLDPAELKKLRKAKPGDVFNLDAGELNDLRAAGKQNEAAFRRILFARLADYHARGLDGFRPYLRTKDKQVDPARELRAAMAKEELLAKVFPDFFAALMRYPHELPTHIESHYYWHVATTQGRPNPMLTHRLVWRGDGELLLAERRIYAAHTINVAQTLTGVAPGHNGGAMVFSTTRLSTDNVDGFPLGVRHKVGKKKLLERVVQRFKALRDG